MWELDNKESWALKNWCFWTVVLKKTLESPLDCKEIQPVHPKGDQSWVFIGRTDVEAETPILWPPDAKNWLIWKDPDAGKDWGQEEKGMTEDEMVGWHHRLSGHELEWAPGVGDGQGGLACCNPWGHKESYMTEQLSWAELCHLPSSVLGSWMRASTAKEPSALSGDRIWQKQLGQWVGGSPAKRGEMRRCRIVINAQCRGVGWCLVMGPAGWCPLGLGIHFREAQRVEGRGWACPASCKDTVNSDLLRTYYCRELTLAGRVEGCLRNTVWIWPATTLWKDLAAESTKKWTSMEWWESMLKAGCQNTLNSGFQIEIWKSEYFGF